MDDVLTQGFAYGVAGDKLDGKDLQLLVSVGGRHEFYNGFDIFCTIPDLLRPLQITANLTRMNYLIPEWMYEADIASQDTIEQNGRRWITIIDDPRRSNPRKYLYVALLMRLARLDVVDEDAVRLGHIQSYDIRQFLIPAFGLFWRKRSVFCHSL